jgi:PKD repeat protein
VLALAGVVALAAGALGYASTSAQADAGSQQIVSATVYSASGTSMESATLSGLAACPTYSGPSTMQEFGLNGFVPVTFPQNAWALSTILGCLAPQPVTLTGQGGVTVINADGSPETGSGSQLTAADLAPPGKTDFNNPAEGPVVSDIGTANRYDRPWRGPSQGQPDYDYSDQVTTDSPNGQATPVQIEVFEGPLLTVTVSASPTTVKAGQPVTFATTVTGEGDSALSYSWSFDGGAPGSAAPSPQVTFGSAGQYNVTVQVTDTQGGGGVASIPITVGTPPAPATGGHKQKGAGKNKKSHSPTGPVKSSGSHAGGKAGKQNNGQSTTPSESTTTTSSSTTTTPTSPNTPTSTNTSTATTPSPSSAPRASTAHRARTSRKRATSASRVRPTTPPPQSGSTVVGLLVSDVTPLPSDVSPLVRTVLAPATAPPARQAIRASLLPALGAGLAVLLLLGLGAGRELRGRRGRRTPRVGS